MTALSFRNAKGHSTRGFAGRSALKDSVEINAETTIDCYIRAVEDFSQRFRLPPDRLGPRHIREYQAELFQKQKLATPTVRSTLAALRFFYIKTLKKAWSVEDTPYPRKTRRLPTILSQEEVARLIDAARPPLHRTLLNLLK